MAGNPQQAARTAIEDDDRSGPSPDNISWQDLLTEPEEASNPFDSQEYTPRFVQLDDMRQSAGDTTQRDQTSTQPADAAAQGGGAGGSSGAGIQPGANRASAPSELDKLAAELWKGVTHKPSSAASGVDWNVEREGRRLDKLPQAKVLYFLPCYRTEVLECSIFGAKLSVYFAFGRIVKEEDTETRKNKECETRSSDRQLRDLNHVRCPETLWREALVETSKSSTKHSRKRKRSSAETVNNDDDENEDDQRVARSQQPSTISSNKLWSDNSIATMEDNAKVFLFYSKTQEVEIDSRQYPFATEKNNATWCFATYAKIGDSPGEYNGA